ncbi:hypothetical protein [uncultured Desulfosarcina sp.]|uniref:hypothetical protein n=1 Tax=uncultured Desulfosarcina sp. TaxID=218289 RepID=UPI0029C677E2|nr:hypothetical protein [uncultured Desulfosarcina sp.]
MQEHLSEDFLDVTFTKRPKVSQDNNFWVFTWNGIDVILPPAAFEHIFLFKDSGGQYLLHLSAADDIRISLLANKNELFEDVFAVSEIGEPKVTTTAKGIAATEAMYGGPVRFSELMTLAYECTPKEITCCAEKGEEEMGKVVALIMKVIDGPDIVAAYKGVGRYNGWLTKSRSGGRVEYRLNILSESDEEHIYQATYQITENAPYHTFPHLVGAVDRHDAAQPPDWVPALEAALKEDSAEAWQDFLSAAEEGGISEKSRSSVRKIIEKKNTP